MLRYFTSLLLYLHLISSLSGQVKIEPSPEWAVQYEVNSKFAPDKSEMEGGYYPILNASQYYTPTFSTNYQSATAVFNSAGVESNSTHEITYNPAYQKLIFHRIALVRQGTMLDQHSTMQIHFADLEEDAYQMIYDGRKTATLHFKDVRVNDILYLNYSIQGENPVFSNHIGVSFPLYTYSDTMDHLVVSLVTPLNKKINYKLHSTTIAPVITEKNNLRYYTWELKNLSSQRWAFYPGWYDPYPTIYISDFNSWHEIKDWARPLFTSYTPGAGIQQWVSDVQKTYPEVKDQVTYAIRWVQNEVRYLGLEFNINSHKPADPNQVFINRHGDCKDKSLLLCEMLRLLKVDAHPVLVNTWLDHKLPDYLPSASLFNHCIVFVEMQGQEFFIDPTINFQGGVAPMISTPSYGYGLVLDDQSRDLVEMGAPSLSTIHTHEEYFVRDKVTGGSMTVTTVYTGMAADKVRSDFQYGSYGASQESYIQYYENVFDGVRAAEKIKTHDDSILNVFTVVEQYDVDQFWVPLDSTKKNSADVIYLRAGTINEYLPGTPDESYKGPLDLRYPYQVDHKITAHMPETWPGSLNNLNVTNDFFRFSSVFTTNDKTVTCHYTYATLAPFVPEENVHEILDDLKKIENENGIHLMNSAENTTGIGVLLHIAVCFICLVIFGAGAWILYRWDPPAKEFVNQYHSIGGWLILPAIGLATRVIFNTFNIAVLGTHSNAYWQYAQLKAFKVPASEVLLLSMVMILQVAMACFCIVVCILFFKRRTSLPVLIIFYFLASVVNDALQWFEMTTLKHAIIFEEKDIRKSASQAIGIVIASIFWIPYFLKSERVAGTFTKTVRKAAPPAVPVMPPPIPSITDPAPQASLDGNIL